MSEEEGMFEGKLDLITRLVSSWSTSTAHASASLRCHSVLALCTDMSVCVCKAAESRGRASEATPGPRRAVLAKRLCCKCLSRRCGAVPAGGTSSEDMITCSNPCDWNKDAH
eukprot:750890-Hanusia_phi.AAC.1